MVEVEARGRGNGINVRSPPAAARTRCSSRPRHSCTTSRRGSRAFVLTPR